MSDIFKNIESILEADTGDLRVLAGLVGADPRVMYSGADLSGADLRAQDISFLSGLNTDFKRAKLTVEQRQFLERYARDDREKIERRSQIATARLELVSRFVERQLDLYSLPLSKHDLSEMSDALVENLMEPLRAASARSNPSLLGDSYVLNSLRLLSRFSWFSGDPFLIELFRLFSGLKLRLGREFVRYSSQIIRDFGSDERALTVLLSYGLSDDQVIEWIDIDVRDRKGRAMMVMRHIVVSPFVAEELLLESWAASDLVTIAESIVFSKSRDHCEAVAYLILKNSKEQRLLEILNSKAETDFKRALVR
tara:strand:+ start:180 stop:1109 length:930 start_codon:yes stop_codon:yes gene_type:complete